MLRRKILTAFSLCFLHMVLVIGSRCKNKSEIQLFDPIDNSIRCWPVPTCQEGQQPSVEPGSVYPKTTTISCIPCDYGWFSNHDTNYRCQKCTSCGNKGVLVNCSIYGDAVCSKSCKSNTHYFNESDGQCYACTECCGKDQSNIERQCLLSSGNLRVGSVIGQQGELHCKVQSSQKCDELSKNVTTYINGSSFVNGTSSVVENCNCTRPENMSLQDIMLLCALIVVALACVFFLCLYIRERKMRMSRSGCPPESCPFMNPCYSGLAGQPDSETAASSLMGFEEKLQYIPEALTINRIPFKVEQIILKLDGRKLSVKNWYPVARTLGLSMDETDNIRREEGREGGSPTSALLSQLTTWDSVITLRQFVRVLHQLGRHDVTKLIFDFYRNGEQQAVTSSV